MDASGQGEDIRLNHVEDHRKSLGEPRVWGAVAGHLFAGCADLRAGSDSVIGDPAKDPPPMMVKSAISVANQHARCANRSLIGR